MRSTGRTTRELAVGTLVVFFVVATVALRASHVSGTGSPPITHRADGPVIAPSEQPAITVSTGSQRVWSAVSKLGRPWSAMSAYLGGAAGALFAMSVIAFALVAIGPRARRAANASLARAPPSVLRLT